MTDRERDLTAVLRLAQFVLETIHSRTQKECESCVAKIKRVLKTEEKV